VIGRDVQEPLRALAEWLHWTLSLDEQLCSRYCVVSRMVTPSATRSRMSCHMVWRLRGSRPVVGSSRKISRGRPIKVIAMSRRRLSRRSR
jgi:hypothetical protein